MNITIVGIGLIGGSMAISLRESGIAAKLIGVDKNEGHQKKAITLGLVDEILTLNEAILQTDVVIVATPVDSMIHLLPNILDKVNERQVVMDVGSTKVNLLKTIKYHPNRKQFIATHPMAGTEYSGPEAAVPNLFDGKCTVICDKEDSSIATYETAKKIYAAMNMRLVELDAEAHDTHTAYVSHISHISSFALALTVLEKEQNENRIFELASGGFGSTVRLAKSSPDMWAPIFEQNRDNVLDVLDEHINTLAKFRSLLIKRDFKTFYALMEQANDIKRILK